MKLFSKRHKPEEYGWFGTFDSWESASKQSSGYQQDDILAKTRDALQQVKTGKAIYERDTILFDKKEYPFPLLTFLLRDALQLQRPLNVLDFGGSLGSTYFQVRDFLTAGNCASWNIVEQPHYIDCGRQFFEDDVLKFFYSIRECIKSTAIDFVILSSVVQYLPDPHGFLNELVTFGFPTILVDRTAFINAPSDRLTIQRVWPSVYEGSYPAWFFNEERFLSHFTRDYQLNASFGPYVTDEAIIKIDQLPVGYSSGMCFTRR